MGMPSMPELLIILVIVLLLFGAKKIPELAKGLGSGIKNFKNAVKEEDKPAIDAAEKTETASEVKTAEKTEKAS